MASVHKHLRSSTASKRPVASGIADGQLAINTASGTPGLFFKDSAGSIVKVGPAHVGTAAPNASPAGSAGNSLGELWVDSSLTTPGLKYYTGAAFVNLTPSGTATTVGLVELATDAETQVGADSARAVTPASLQSKVSDSTSTTSSTTIASSTAVKSAYDLANAALPKAGGTVTGELLIGASGSFVFEGSTDNTFETTITVVDPTADRTITFPNITGTVITTGDSGTVTSTMIADGAIVNADINASAAIADSKLDTIATADKVSLSALNIDGATDIGGALADVDLFIVDDGAGGTNRKAAASRITDYAFGKVSGDITITSSGVSAIAAGIIVDADVNASAAIAGTKISPDFGAQNVVTTGNITGGAFIPTATGVPTNGLYLADSNKIGFASNSFARYFVDGNGVLLYGSANSPVVGSTEYVQVAGHNGFMGTAGPGGIFLRKGVYVSGVTTDDTVGQLTYGAERATGARIRAVAESQWNLGDTPTRFVFDTTTDGSGSPTEKARLNNAGYFKATAAGAYYSATGNYHELIGNEDSNHAAIILNNSATSPRALFLGLGASPDNNTATFLLCNDTTTTRAVIWSDGDMQNHDGVFTQLSSDLRLKQDIEDANSQWEDIKNIKFKNYRWKNEPQGPKQLGVIAQELEEVCPGLIMRRPANPEEINPANGINEGDEILSYKMSIMFLKATVALQEAMLRIEQLEARLADAGID